nr:hypothetical protein [Burkholderia cepacia]
MHKLPHLFKSRRGVFYLRLARSGQEVKRSLHMKDFRQARLLALASLRLDQLQREGDVWFFDIQKAKNANSLRRIPLQRVVVESGFLAYVEDLRARRHPALSRTQTRGKPMREKRHSQVRRLSRRAQDIG